MPVTDAELASLASGHDIISLGMLADEARRQRHGTRVTFVRVAGVSSEPGSPCTVPAAAGEVRIGGRPGTLAEALARVREMALASGRVPLSGFSLADLEALASREGMTLRALLEELRAAGLELVAEAPYDALADPRRSIEEVNIAGLALARLTINQTPPGDAQAFYRKIAALQHVVAVIRAFAPLPRVVDPSAPTTGYDDVKRVALARLYVDNIPSIQVDWSLYGPKLAQVALTMGADDVDAVSPLEGEGDGPRRSPIQEMRRCIVAAGFSPVERDGRFDPLPQ